MNVLLTVSHIGHDYAVFKRKVACEGLASRYQRVLKAGEFAMDNLRVLYIFLDLKILFRGAVKLVHRFVGVIFDESSLDCQRPFVFEIHHFLGEQLCRVACVLAPAPDVLIDRL